MLAITVLASGTVFSEAQAQSKPAPRPASGALAEAKSAPPGAPAPPTLSKTPLPFDEEVPPAGADNLMFSDAEIRYCLAQIIRIEAVRLLVDRYERAQVGYFNELVADYNSRCGHYRYMEGARESAQAQVEISRSTIESDARQAYQSRFVEPEKSSAPTRPATTPPKEAKKPPKPAAAAAQADTAASQPARSAPPKQQPATPTRTEPAQSAAAQTQAKQQPSESPPATPPAASQPERSAAPPPQTAPPQPVTAVPNEGVQPAAAQPQAKPQASEPPASTPAPGAQPERLATPASQASPQAPGAIASAQDTRITQPSTSAPAGDQTSPPVPAPDASSHASQPAPSGTQAQTKPQSESSSAATPVSPQSDRSRDAAPAPETKPTTVAKASTRSAPPGAIERFTREIERAGSQVLDQRDYPSEARDKKWQGTTLIEVRYAEGGYIRSIVVGQSCGHPVLDEQAVQIARNLRLPNAPEELRPHEFAVRFPIVFQLSRP